MKLLLRYSCMSSTSLSFSVDPNRPGDYKEAFNVSGRSYGRADVQWPDDLSPKFSRAFKNFMCEAKTLTLIILNALGHGMKLQVSRVRYIRVIGRGTALTSDLRERIFGQKMFSTKRIFMVPNYELWGNDYDNGRKHGGGTGVRKPIHQQLCPDVAFRNEKY